MHWIILVSLIVFAINICPSAVGQSYNYSYGNSRVINQSSNGLAYPSSTYIGSGTMSKSAQGIIQSGAQVNPGLPKVNRGAYIGTPGDNLYSGNPILSQEQKHIIVKHADRIIYKPQPKETANTYVPDPNIPMTYADFKSESSAPPEKNIVSVTGNTPNATSKQSSATENPND